MAGERHRLLLLQSELRTAQVTQAAITADLSHAESLLAERATRIEELERAAVLDYQASRTRVEQLEKARQAEKDAKFESSELAVQMVGASAANMSLRAEVALLEGSLVSAVEEGRTMLMRLHASATERAAQHRKQLEMWESRASVLLDAGPTAKLDLVLMQGNASLFDDFRALLSEQRDNCEKEQALLREWESRQDGRTRTQLQGQVSPLRRQVQDISRRET